jgi:hypothetical protein
VHDRKTWVLVYALFPFSRWRWRYVRKLVALFGGFRWDRVKYAVGASYWSKKAQPRMGAVAQAQLDHTAFMGLANSREALEQAVANLDRFERLP